ncbi:hypothetical protein GP486_002481 [Trichoglossum hirsutum]|uniref:PLC-like phosphodiesterase n=1 Tax=Trichoglossum hirsutum TaxID=265104 RepID=A0A9P8RS22_9PEZI|nr:hypothetical protein GP486_002481 [Trichoglossum hirsutum]
MPSKGVECYSYIGAPGYTIDFAVPKGGFTASSGNNFRSHDLEIDAKALKLFEATGRFQWTVKKDGQAIEGRYAEISPYDGNVHSGNMSKIMDEKSVIHGDSIITYGFYGAGPGVAGLTNKHQCYVTVSPNYSSWMGTLAPVASGQASRPFSTFVLPAPHDCGMNNMDTISSIMNAPNGSKIRDALLGRLGIIKDLEAVAVEAAKNIAPNIMLSLAMTEKDSISTLLALGARYFEFRPAYMHDDIRSLCPNPNTLYFQHACIPGLAYVDFLREIVSFLDTYPTEIVVIHLRWDGVLPGCAKPSADELSRTITSVTSGSRTGVKAGDRTCLNRQISDLRSSGQRIIIVQMDATYSSYDDAAYATLIPDPIVSRLRGMNTSGQAGNDFTLLQCQGTASSIEKVWHYSIVASNTSDSCLLETKAKFDTATLPWVRDNALNVLRAEQTIVVMNDFLDGATTDVVIGLNRERFR